jgi:hypothetical protein
MLLTLSFGFVERKEKKSIRHKGLFLKPFYCGVLEELREASYPSLAFC